MVLTVLFKPGRVRFPVGRVVIYIFILRAIIYESVLLYDYLARIYRSIGYCERRWNRYWAIILYNIIS